MNEAPRLRSSDITLTALLRSGRVMVTGKVAVVDQSGTALPGAMVYIPWTLPAGKTVSQSATTNSNGVATFTVKAGRGTYTLQINNIAESEYTFDSAISVLTRSITK